MTQIKKLAWAGSSVALAALMAVALLVAGPLGTANAAFANVVVTVTDAGVGGLATLEIDGTADNGTDSVTFTIPASSDAVFAFNSGKSLVCVDNDPCDIDNNAEIVTVRVTKPTPGTVGVTYTISGADAGTGVATLTFIGTAAQANSTISASPTTSATNTNVTITTVWRDSAGQPLADNSTVTYTLSGVGGTLSGGAAGAHGCTVDGTAVSCTDQINADTDALAENAGESKILIQGATAGQTITVTAIRDAVILQTSVTIAGGAATVELSLNKQAVQSGATVNASAIEEVRATAIVRDASGSILNGGNVEFRVLDANGNTATAFNVGETNAGANRDLATTLVAACSGGTNAGFCTDAIQTVAGVGTGAQAIIQSNGATSGTYTVRARVSTPSGNVDATATFVASGAAASVTLTVPTIGVTGQTTGTIEVEVKDAGGRPVADGTVVTLVVGPATRALILEDADAGTAGNQRSTVGGKATATLVALEAGNAALTATAGTQTQSVAFTVAPSAATPTTPGAGFTGTIAASGVSIVSFDGGSVADLAAAAADAGLISVWVTVEGNFVGYIVGAPAFVNAAFNAQFADGVPAGTLAIVVK